MKWFLGCVVVLLLTAGERAVLDLSVNMAEGQWLNVHGAAAFTMEHGWFTDLRIDEARLSDWDLGPALVGQQLAQNANQSLARNAPRTPLPTR